MRIEADDMSLANAVQLAELGIAAQRTARAAGRSIQVSGVPADMLSLATVYGVDSVLPIFHPARP